MMILLAILATSGSCVTKIMVRPSAFNFLNSSTISWDELVSRLPVGSSARINLGLVIRANLVNFNCLID